MRVPAAPNPFLAACQRPFLASSTLRLQPLLKLLIRVLQKLQASRTGWRKGGRRGGGGEGNGGEWGEGGREGAE